jgi:hypothetical protein
VSGLSARSVYAQPDSQMIVSMAVALSQHPRAVETPEFEDVSAVPSSSTQGSQNLLRSVSGADESSVRTSWPIEHLALSWRGPRKGGAIYFGRGSSWSGPEWINPEGDQPAQAPQAAGETHYALVAAGGADRYRLCLPPGADLLHAVEVTAGDDFERPNGFERQSGRLSQLSGAELNDWIA